MKTDFSSSAGTMWIRDAWRILKKSPLNILGIVGFYLTVLFVVNMPGEFLGIDEIGVVLGAMVTPFAALAFASAGRDVTHNIPFNILSAFYEGWRVPTIRFKLLALGFIYGALVVFNNHVIRYLSASEVAQWQFKDGIFVAESISAHIPWTGIIVGSILYILILFVTCFAPMLIAWRKQSIGKAFFFSLFICLRNLLPFVALGCCYFSIALIGTIAVSTLSILLGGLSSIVIIFWAIFMTAWCYCALWPMWVTFFGSDQSHV